MSWVTPTERATGYKVPATVWNQDAVNNPIYLQQHLVMGAGLSPSNFQPSTIDSLEDVTGSGWTFVAPVAGTVLGTYYAHHGQTDVTIASGVLKIDGNLGREFLSNEEYTGTTYGRGVAAGTRTCVLQSSKRGGTSAVTLGSVAVTWQYIPTP